MFFNAQGRWYILSLVVQYDRRTTKQCECSTGIEPLIFGFYAPMPYRWTTEGSIVSWLVAYVFNISEPNDLKSCKEM